jgi:hypothetical protein
MRHRPPHPSASALQAPADDLPLAGGGIRNRRFFTAIGVAGAPALGNVTICSALNLFFGMTSSFPSYSLTTLGLKKPGQVTYHGEIGREATACGSDTQSISLAYHGENGREADVPP